jgi:large subunit ribosomal protein L4
VVLIDDLKLTAAKTKDFVAVLQALGLDGNTNLVVVGAADKSAYLASRNVSGVELKTACLVNTYDLLKYDKLVFTKAGFEAVEARIAK